MKSYCPNVQCVLSAEISPDSGSVVRNGFYYRSSDSKRIMRFHCKRCGLYFSRATQNNCVHQKKRRINFKLYELVSSGVSLRRAALILKVNRKTVVRRFRFLAEQAREKESKRLALMERNAIIAVQFDDLETSEHTKCKPLSVALAVDPSTRQILGFQVSIMPAKGLLAKKSIKKYGYRKDLRRAGWNQLFLNLKPIVHGKAIFTSDENPHYAKALKSHFPDSVHVRVPGGRGCVTGQGELKKLKFDPLFSLNHTCAMLRANLNRLFRKTWCTTKNAKGLVDHLSIYQSFHNSVLIRSCAP